MKVGRLFWKFFFSIWLAQVAAVLAISGAVWVKDRNRAKLAESIEFGPPAWFMLDASEVTLRAGGISALRELLQKGRHEHLYAVDAQGRDMLGRAVDPATIDQVRRLHEQDPHARAVRALVAPDGSRWLLYAARHEPGSAAPPHGEPPMQGMAQDRPPPPPDGGPPRHHPGGWRIDPHFPMLPMLFAVIASFLSAALLAWHFAKPIRNLRAAFDAAASGRLDVRIGAEMGKRKDELADLGQDFDRMAAQLQALVDGQRRLLHDVSHELRSPLARMHAAIGLARQNPGKLEATLERIERESSRMDTLIGELLTLSRLEAGVTGLLDDSVDIDELASEVADDARFEARAEGKDVVFSNGEHLVLRGRAELLHSALENVVRNAVRHTAPSTSVAVTVEGMPAEGCVRISVRDHGPGVPENELEKIFHPFVRSGTAASMPGHGLGLAIARRVVEAHGGSIRAINAKEGGLLVEIRLPAA